MAKKLVCDRCAFELRDRGDIEIALEGEYAWKMASRARGQKARGVIPCKHYRDCGGEMIMVRKQPRWIAKLTGSEEKTKKGGKAN